MSTLINKGYFVTQLKDQASGQNGIYLFGFTDNDYLIAMRVSIEGIKASADISSRFMAYIGMIGIILGSLVIFIFHQILQGQLKYGSGSKPHGES